jgi:hypothetical protein
MIALPRRLNPLLLPSVAVFTVLFLSPLVYFFIVSFWEVKTFQLRATFTFKNYIDTFNEYAEVGLFTFTIAAVIASITTFLAFGFAYVVRFKAGRFGSILLFGAIIALFGGYLAKVYAWKTILGTNGILNNALLAHPLAAAARDPAHLRLAARRPGHLARGRARSGRQTLAGLRRCHSAPMQDRPVRRLRLLLLDLGGRLCDASAHRRALHDDDRELHRKPLRLPI